HDISLNGRWCSGRRKTGGPGGPEGRGEPEGVRSRAGPGGCRPEDGRPPRGPVVRRAAVTAEVPGAPRPAGRTLRGRRRRRCVRPAGTTSAPRSPGPPPPPPPPAAADTA